MPRPLAKDPQSGTYLTVDPQTNEWRPLTDEEFGNLRPSKVLDQMGVSAGERFALKNFLNPGTAYNYLRSQGYEVMPYGSGLNFAVRKSPQDPWLVVDPSKGGIREFFQDILDLSVGDIALPAAGAVAGGLLGGPVGAGAGAAGSELVRQGIGAAITGQGENISPGQVGAVGAIGAALPIAGKYVAAPVGRAARAAARGVEHGLGGTGAITRGAETILSRISGIQPASNLAVRDIFSARVKAGHRPAFVPADVAEIFRRHMDTVAKPSLDALGAERDALIREAVVDMRPVVQKQLATRGEAGDLFREILGFATPKRLDPKQHELNAVLRDLLDPPTMEQAAARAKALSQPSTILGPSGAPVGRATVSAQQVYREMLQDWMDNKIANVPAPIAARVRTELQHYLADFRAAYGGVSQGAPGASAPLKGRLDVDLERFTNAWKNRFHEDLAGQGLGDAVRMDAEIAELASARNLLRDYFGANVESANNAIRNLYNPGNEDKVAAIARYSRAFPSTHFPKILRNVYGPAAAGAPGDIEGIARESFIASRFTPRIGTRETFGFPEAISRPTAVGTPLGLQFVSGALGGTLGAVGGTDLGGPLGGVGGGIGGATLGFVALSPSTLVRVYPHFVKGGRVARTVAGRVAALHPPPLSTGGTREAANLSLQALARNHYNKTLVRVEPPPKKRKSVLY